MTNAIPYMEALGKETGLDVSLSEAGSAAFDLGGRGLLLQWQEAAQAFVVYVEVGPLAGWRDGEVCRRLLSANFLLVQTGGSALSYNEITNMVGLNRSIPVYGLSPQDFMRKLDAVIVQADEWKAALAGLCAEQEQAVAREQDAAARTESGSDPDAAPLARFLRV